MKRSRTVAALVILTMLLLYVSERISVVKVGYDIEKLKSQKVKLERERDEMKVKLSSLSAPERIAKVATEQLGMVPPKQGQVVLGKQRGGEQRAGLERLQAQQAARDAGAVGLPGRHRAGAMRTSGAHGTSPSLGKRTVSRGVMPRSVGL